MAKKVINNLLYDTETATLIVSETAKDGSLIKRLYMTKNRGFFFLIIASDEIKPISEAECREWLGLFSYQAYVNVFGEPQKA